MNTIDEILQLTQLLPGIISLFQSLAAIVGKDQANSLTQEAIASPAVKPAVQQFLSKSVQAAHAAAS